MEFDEFADIHKKACAAARELSGRKGHDYSGDEDTLKNLKLCEAAGICTAEQGVLVRILDKLSRMAELDRPGNEAQVKDEALGDTELDVVNYTILHRALRVERHHARLVFVDEAEGEDGERS